MTARARAECRRSGSLLVVVLGVTLCLSLAGVAFLSWSSRTTRTAGWSRDHLVVRMLAESAVEELYLRLQSAANTPSDPVFTALRTAALSAKGPPVPLPSLKLTAVLADLANLARATGTTVDIVPPAAGRAFVELAAGGPLSSGLVDPAERAGFVSLEVAVRMGGRATGIVERVKVSRSFSVARTGFPRFPPLAGPRPGFSLLVGGSANLPGRTKGALSYASASAASSRSDTSAFKSVLSFLTEPFPNGLGAAGPATSDRITQTARLFEPDLLAQRAQFVVTSPLDFIGLLGSRIAHKPALALNGLVYHSGTEQISLAIERTPFRGRCVLASRGPIRLGTIKLADPLRDSLTVISGAGVIVDGAVVDAALVSIGKESPGVVFLKRSRVLGPIATAQMFASIPGTITAKDLGASELGTNGTLDAGSADRELENYTALFSPHPVTLEHTRE